MIKTCILIFIISAIVCSKGSSLKKSAVFDEKRLNLTNNESKTFEMQSIDTNKAFMINLEQIKTTSPNKKPSRPTKKSNKAEQTDEQHNNIKTLGDYSQQDQKLNNKEANKIAAIPYGTPFTIGLQITITTKDNSTHKCIFSYSNNLCVVEKPSREMIVNLNCTADTCDYSLLFSQRDIISSTFLSNKAKRQLNDPGQIYKLEKRTFNSILQIFSERQEYSHLSSEVKIFSNVHVFSLDQVEELQANNALFALKPIINANDQYLFIENYRASSTEHLKFNIKSHTGELTDGNSIVDFIQNYGRSSKNIYVLNSAVKDNIQAKLRLFSPSNPKGLHFVLRVLGKSSKEQQAVEIGVLKFDPIEFDGVKLYDFSYVIPRSLHGKFKMIYFETYLSQGENRSLFFELQVRDLKVCEISILEDVFFNAKAKETIEFIVEPQLKLGIQGTDKDIALITNSSQKYYSSIQSCSLHNGCELSIKTDASCAGCSFKFDLQDQDIKNGIIFYDVHEGAIGGRIDLEQIIYFKYSIKAKGVVQIVANSVNIIMYAIFDDYKSCRVPKPNCQQHVINHHNPVFIENNLATSRTLVIALYGLEKTSFKIRFLEKTDGIALTLGEKFTYLFDDNENSISLKYINKVEDNLFFNLLSPINSLTLTVSNADGQTLTSSEGYIVFKRNELRGDLFEIKIEKTKDFMLQYVHFTLILSTNDTAVRLDSTITHYERYLPTSSKTFVVEFDPSIKSALNIYTENLQKQQSSFLATFKIIKNSEQQQQQEDSVHLATLMLVRSYEFISLDELMSKVDQCQDINCQIEITLKNQGNASLDQAITLFSSESVINLDDSLWNVFSINELSISNHFYFIPRNKNHSIHVLFNTDNRNIFITYRIHNHNDNINPQDWPFANSFETTQFDRVLGNRDILIPKDDPQIAKCWPNCVILINVNEVKKQQPKQEPTIRLFQFYKILATDNIIQIPEDTKLELTLAKQQVVSLFVLLQNFQESKELTFFTSYIIGSGSISASIVSNGQEYNLHKNNKMFWFQGVETRIPLEMISSVLQEKHVTFSSSMLKITIKAESELRMEFQFTSEIKDIYRISMGQLQMINLYRQEQTIYQFIPERAFNLKLYRIRGIPMYKIINCAEENYISCITHIKKNLHLEAEKYYKENKAAFKKLTKDENHQDEAIQVADQGNKKDKNVSDTPAALQANNFVEIMLEKNIQISGEACESCVYFVWIYCFDENFQMTVNLRASDSETQLKEFSVLNDRLQKQNSKHRYLLNILPQNEGYLTIRVLAGKFLLQIKGEKQAVIFRKQFDENKLDYKDITIESIDSSKDEQSEQDKKEQSLGQQNGDDYTRRQVFRHIHVTITSTAPVPAQYLISYSNGVRGEYLQDGIVLQKHLIPEIPYTFYYKSRNKKKNPLLTLTSQLEQDMDSQANASNVLSARFYYYPNVNNKTLKEQFKPELPPKKNKNYLGETISHVYELPAKFDLFEIEIQSKSYVKGTISISHEELAYVPLGYQYLIKLVPAERLSIVVENPKTQFLEVNIKKCDDSEPSLYYTNNAMQFKSGNFQSEIDLQNNQIKQYIKAQKTGPIYLMLVGDETESTILSLYVTAADKKTKKQAIKYKLGNQGIIDYKIGYTDDLQINFKPILCNGKACTNTINYYLIIGASIDDIYLEINCAASFFIPQAKSMIDKLKTEIIPIDIAHYNATVGGYSYKIKLNNSQGYVGIRAVIQEGKGSKDINYVPIRISSLWRQLNKISVGLVIMVAGFFSILMTLVVVISTKIARKGYTQISLHE